MEPSADSQAGANYQVKYLKLEEDYNELHKNLQLSAVYGKSLLDENNSLKQQIKNLQSLQEEAAQENHHMRMQLEVAQKSHVSQVQELEAIKEALQKMEEENQQFKAMDEEQHRKELSHATEMACIKDQEQALKEEYSVRIKELEAEISQVKSVQREPVVVNCNHEEEISQLQVELELVKESNGKLEADLVAKHRQIYQLQQLEIQLNKNNAELESSLLAKEKEIASCEKLLEEKRVEALEFQALLEAERVSQTNPDKRGNSIFGEVEDRRQQVERQMAKLKTLLDKEQRKNQELQAEIVKVKNQMAFLACGGGGNAEASKSVEQLEILLRASNGQNQTLLKKIEELEQKIQSSASPIPPLEDSKKWMQAMLNQKQEENDKLKSEIRDHIRSSLCQSDQTMQLTKRLTETEKNLQRARSEVFRLKLKIEDMVTNNENVLDNASPIHSIPPTRIVESLKCFVEKKDEPSTQQKPLIERVVLQETQLEPNALVDSSSSIIGEISPPEKVNCTTTNAPPSADDTTPIPFGDPTLERIDETIDKKKKSEAKADPKRQVRMNSQVHVVFDDGDSTLETLADDKFSAKAIKTAEKPVGHKVEVVDISEAPSAANDCKTQ